MASWFTEGNVAVTNGSTVVTGTNTKFSNCRSGDMFVGPDSAIYQVSNPSSDTAVSISPAYRGATTAGAVYGIVPVNGYPKALADAVNQMVQQWGSTLAGLGAVSTENVVPIAKGGTGATTAAAARAALELKRTAITDIVGTVAQSGGVPTGAIIESGSTSSGSYTKFADGTLISIIKNAGPFPVAANAATVVGPFAVPVAFASGDFFCYAVAAPSATYDTFGVVGAYAVSQTSMSFAYRNGPVGQSIGNLKILCIGRWF